MEWFQILGIAITALVTIAVALLNRSGQNRKVEIDRVIQVNEVLQEENGRLLERLKNTEGENDELKNRLDILEGENDELKDGLAEANKGLAKAQKEILQLQHEIAVMKEYWRTK